jgi:hypothetical protein
MFNIEKLTNGKIGELIIAEHFKHAKMSEDWYDSEKDGTLGEERYEVKTLRLNHKITQGFWIEQNQWNKLDNVEKVFFVKVPEKIEEGIQVYLCLDHKTCYELVPGRPYMRSYPIKNCELLFTIYDERVNIVYENSVTMSKHKRYA